MVRPKKGLGQHFLIKKDIAWKIVDSFSAESCNSVVEIGPGKGILTELLLKRTDIELFCVEIDKEATVFLLQHYPDIEGKLITGDILKTDLAQFGSGIGIIGNFPYYISSQIFFHILECRDKVKEIVCMVQKEVAERIVSPPGNKKYGILSVLLQTWYDAEYLFSVDSDSFYPKPAVESGVIRLVRNNRKEISCDEGFHKKVIKTAFNQRRKMLRNTISGFVNGMKMEDPRYSRRPEQLSADEFVELAIELESVKYNNA